MAKPMVLRSIPPSSFWDVLSCEGRLLPRRKSYQPEVVCPKYMRKEEQGDILSG